MKQTLWLLAGGLCLATGGFAQRLSPQVLSVSGGSARGQTVQLEWTVGESAVQSYTGADRMYTEGFHQPHLQVIPEAFKSDAPEIAISVAPNPVASTLEVRIQSMEQINYTVQVVDLNGKVQINRQTTAEQTELNVQHLPAGAYVLRVNGADDRTVRTFKVIKTN